MRSIGTTLQRARTMWRWPLGSDELPLYVQRSFRAKTFGLISLQFAVVFLIMLAVHYAGADEWCDESEVCKTLYWCLAVATLFSLMLLFCMHDKFPANYALLVTTTAVVGLFWGLTRAFFVTWLHFQLAGILGIAMAVAALSSAALTTSKVEAWNLVLVSVLFGWVTGSLIVTLVGRFLFDVPQGWSLAAICLSFLLLMGLLSDVGGLLVRCNPDTFMRVVVAMDSTLLVVVSIPVFILSWCLMHTNNVQNEAEPGPPADAPPPQPPSAQPRLPAQLPF